ncbi:MAG: DNA-3-methyladenine glycosylase II [Paraglaciecola sp.]|jgi:DNA-3-methyladenine glycosylase II
MRKEIITHLSKDSNLKKLIETVEIAPAQERGDLYSSLMRAIVGQQLSVKAASTIHGRFMDLFEDGYAYPEELLAMDLPILKSVGLSRQKSGYVQNIAHFFTENELQDKDWESMTDDEVIDFLTPIKGVGKWTVQMILMFTLHRDDVFPVDDLGIQNSMRNIYKMEETGRAFKAKMKKISLTWQPYRTHACRLLWRWQDQI